MNFNSWFSRLFIFICANASAAAKVISDITHRFDAICSDAPKFVLCDFNQCQLNMTLRTYKQTHRTSTIDLCGGSVSGAYTPLPLSSLGASYHNSMYLMPLYTPSVRRPPPADKSVKRWSEDSTSSLQACFDCTDWQCVSDACGDNMSFVTLYHHTSHPVWTPSSQLKRLFLSK